MIDGVNLSPAPIDDEHQSAEPYDKYSPLIDAANHFIDKILDQKAMSVLRISDQLSNFPISIFTNELEHWPYAGDPRKASNLDLMFWGFQSQVVCSSMRSALEREVEECARHVIKSMESSLRDLVVEVCYLDSGNEPAETSLADLEELATTKLAKIVKRYLSDYDREILSVD